MKTTKKRRKVTMKAVTYSSVTVSEPVPSPPGINLLRSTTLPWPWTPPQPWHTSLLPPRPFIKRDYPPHPPSTNPIPTRDLVDRIFLPSTYNYMPTPPLPLPLPLWSVLFPSISRLTPLKQHRYLLLTPDDLQWNSCGRIRLYTFFPRFNIIQKYITGDHMLTIVIHIFQCSYIQRLYQMYMV